MGMTRFRRSRRKQGATYQSMEYDNNDKFILIKCIEYLQRHVDKHGLTGRESLEFLSWVLGDMRAEFIECTLSCVDESYRKKHESALYEYDLDHMDFSQIIIKILSPLKLQAHKIVMQHLDQILKKRISCLNYQGFSEIEKTAGKLKKLFILSDIEVDLCLFLFIINSYDPPEDFFSLHLHCEKFIGRKFLSNVLATTTSHLNEIFSAVLVKTGIIEIDQREVCLSDDFLCLFQNPSTRIFSEKFYQKASRDSVPLNQHFVAARQTEHILRLLRDKPGTSTHILLYGKPGTGKTSYAYGLVKELAIPSYEVAQDPDNKTKNRRAAITAALNMTNSGSGSILIVDESDNILNTRNSWFERGETQDKGYLNQLMEEPGVRIVWICNSIRNIDPSLLRRFAFSIRFKPFTRKQRVMLFENIIRTNRVKRFFSSVDIDSFARKYDVNAGTINLSIKKAIESGFQSKTEIIKLFTMGLEAYQDMVNAPSASRATNRIENGYSLDGLNINSNIHTELNLLEKFSEHLQSSRHHLVRNMNLLFYGPPGTGKSELARYIANHLDKEMICKRLSDILNPFVGVAEKNIRNAFIEAEREEAVLVIDEADSLLFSREKSVRSWETSQTNEFLTAMERFKGILICTTNMIKEIDKASIRRFSIKLKFDYLTPDGNTVFYDKLLLPLLERPINNNTQASLKKIKNLTPGDFKTVRDRFAFFPKKELAHELFIDALKEEVTIKNTSYSQKSIGF